MSITKLSGSPASALASIFQHRRLIADLTVRDISGRYRGSAGGLIWSFINPLLMLAVYSFVFSVVFKARWGTTHGDTQTGFALMVFMGMIVHGLLGECVNRAPGLILAHTNYVKRVVFPLEILPVVALGSAVFHALVSTAILLVFLVATTGHIPSTSLWLPLVLVPLLLLCLGASWFLAATGVFVRDIGQLTAVLTMVLLFMSPVFYPISALPTEYQSWMRLNPLTFVIEQARAVVMHGQAPDWFGLAPYTLASVLAFAAGYWWFQRSRPGFADVL